MGKFSKLIAAVVGVAVSIGSIYGFDLTALQEPAILGLITTAVTAVFTGFSPANKP